MGTKFQFATKGPDAKELLEKVAALLTAYYHAERVDEATFCIDAPMNAFMFATFYDEILEIVKDYGPDTFFSYIDIKSKGLNFTIRDMGLVESS